MTSPCLCFTGFAYNGLKRLPQAFGALLPGGSAGGGVRFRRAVAKHGWVLVFLIDQRDRLVFETLVVSNLPIIESIY